jgi:glycosyltransferase involved in cell wall biosynthesis
MLDGKLSLVLPAHNEAANIEAVVRRAAEILPTVTREYEVIVVNDGSLDSTGEIVDRLAVDNPNVRAVHHPVNRGYGAALTSGFQAAVGQFIMFMDADRQFDIADINALLPYVSHYDIVAGYRIQRRDPLYRRLYGKLFGVSVWLLFGLHMRDIDCAFKIYRAELLKDLELTTPGALINTEMLVRSRQRGASIAEVGVHHYPRPAGESSGGSPKVVLRAMRETVRLWLRLNREGGKHATGATRARLLAAPLGALAAVMGMLLFWRRRSS